MIGGMFIEGNLENVEIADKNTVILYVGKKEKIFLKKC